MSIATEVWFPVVTLIVGIVLNAYFNARTEARATAREREARTEQRLDVIHQRRSEFQRATLIELQDAVQALGRCTGSASHELIMALLAGRPAKEVRLTAELDEALRVAYADVARLRVRVRDDRARGLAEDFSA